MVETNPNMPDTFFDELNKAPTSSRSRLIEEETLAGMAWAEDGGFGSFWKIDPNQPPMGGIRIEEKAVINAYIRDALGFGDGIKEQDDIEG